MKLLFFLFGCFIAPIPSNCSNKKTSNLAPRWPPIQISWITPVRTSIRRLQM